MTSAYREFTRTYEEFRKRFADHPLNDELRHHLLKRSFPSDEWLKARTDRMKDLLVPLWRRSGQESN